MEPETPSLVAKPFGYYRPGLFTKALCGVFSFDKPHRIPNWLRKRAKRLIRKPGNAWDVRYHGFDLRLYPAENTCDYDIVMRGVHAEEDEFRIFEKVVSGFDTFVDIGANIGLYSLHAFRHMPPGSTIVAFEPAPATAAKLRVNLALNGAEAVHVIEKAVGPAETVLRLYKVNRVNAGQNSLHERLKTDQGEGFDVAVTTLKGALDQLGIDRIGALKIDVEGFEDQALLPYLEASAPVAWPTYVLIERSHSHVWKTDIIGAFLERGYEVVFENAENLHLRRRQAGAKAG